MNFPFLRIGPEVSSISVSGHAPGFTICFAKVLGKYGTLIRAHFMVLKALRVLPTIFLLANDTVYGASEKLSRRGEMRAGCKVFYLLMVIILFPFGAGAEMQPQEDKEWVFEVAAHGASDTYHRPENAEYFWWDTDPAVQVELTFADGKTERANSEKEFSKKIIEVKFINPKSDPVTVKLWARF